ncbi:hepatic lectin-like [Mizuhopecten yessoensis]|uniref:hepatic lectin-like n=1 Tax=Mizuhopecten yessoensis TaxID=6573 RepID=UPI000B45AA9B|nr:hepatic lectin-like [Mizuhopecten yessoensis]
MGGTGVPGENPRKDDPTSFYVQSRNRPPVALAKARIRCHASYIYDPISDLCFQLCGAYNWPDAVAFCAEDDSRLVVFDTLEKLQFYKNYVIVTNDGKGRTIGGRRVNGVWKWVDGSLMSMSKKFWRKGEPTGSGVYILASIHPGMDGIFNDVHHANRPIVCEKP